jgi:hypothetical protein
MWADSERFGLRIQSARKIADNIGVALAIHAANS